VFDKELVKNKLMEWEGALKGYALPDWEGFPSLPLYMDQVTFLLNGYLSLFPEDEQAETIVTPAMINNYVKLKIIPAPVKKRYSREHLAYLVMVCVLKQSMSTGDIRRLIPSDLPLEEVQRLYADFVATVREIQGAFCEAVRQAAMPVLEQDGPPVSHLVFQAAVAANLFRQVTEKLVALRTEAPAAGE